MIKLIYIKFSGDDSYLILKWVIRSSSMFMYSREVQLDHIQTVAVPVTSEGCKSVWVITTFTFFGENTDKTETAEESFN